MLATRAALLEAGVPARQLATGNAPYWYGGISYDSVIPWNEAAGRAMMPAEGTEWLAGWKMRDGSLSRWSDCVSNFHVSFVGG